MNDARSKARSLLSAMSLALGLAAAGQAAGAVIYTESGDAGDYLHSQALAPAGTGFNAVAGTIGDGDTTDAFSFWYGGGRLFVAAARNTGTPDLPLLVPLFARLWSAQPQDPVIPGDPIQPSDPVTPTVADLDGGLAGFDLPAGNYIVQIEVGASVDPPFSIGFLEDDPHTATALWFARVFGPRPLPEPSSPALFAAAALGLGLARRVRRAA